MPSTRGTRGIVLNAVLFLGFWTAIGLSFASQFRLSSAQIGNPVPWSQAISFALADWYVWAACSIPVMAIARRFPLARGVWQQNVVIHLAACTLTSLIYVVLRAGVGQFQASVAGDSRPYRELFEPLLVKTWHFNAMIYWVIISIVHAREYSQKYHEREVNALDLERRLTTARLHALQMQLNPHFLFNTLNSISTLMHRDVAAADRMLVRLCELLRQALDCSETQEVSLQQEVDFLSRYLEIEQTRFGPRLSVKYEIDPATLESRVPNLILQPLVENAVKHGIEPRARPGTILLKTGRDGGWLDLEVRDNGVGLPTDGVVESGIGLSNTRSRLEQLYGTNHRFLFTNADGGGCSVRIRIPFSPFRDNPS